MDDRLKKSTTSPVKKAVDPPQPKEGEDKKDVVDIYDDSFLDYVEESKDKSD